MADIDNSFDPDLSIEFGHQPPSIMAGTVDLALVRMILDMTDKYGVAGVRSVFNEMFPL